MKYILYPRYVTNEKGNRHLVTPHELLDLHDIDDSITVDDCEIVSDQDDFKLSPEDVWLSVSPLGYPQRIN